MQVCVHNRIFIGVPGFYPKSFYENYLRRCLWRRCYAFYARALLLEGAPEVRSSGPLGRASRSLTETIVHFRLAGFNANSAVARRILWNAGLEDTSDRKICPTECRRLSMRKSGLVSLILGCLAAGNAVAADDPKGVD